MQGYAGFTRKIFKILKCKFNNVYNFSCIGMFNCKLITCEIKTWKYYENRKLVKTEKYSKGICHIKTFDNKGRITSTGQSMMVEEPDGTHWYIIGEWTFFDEKGKIIGIRKYDKGVLISEEEINPNPL